MASEKKPQRFSVRTFTHSLSDFVQNLRVTMETRATPWLPQMEGRHLGPHAQPGRRLPSMIDQPPPPKPHRATFWVIIAGLVLVMLLAALSAVIPKLTVIALSE